MIIDLTQSRIFTCDPATRFAKEYQLPKGTWTELWRRYKLLEYTNGDLRDYMFLKYARNLSHPTMYRWLAKAEIYHIVNPLMKEGVKHVNTVIFGDLEEFVMNELVKSIKNGAIGVSKAII
jgi:hypothetical protein